MFPGSWDGVAEPDSDRGDVDGAVDDVGAFVVAGGHGAELFELVDAALDNVAAFVGLGVELGVVRSPPKNGPSSSAKASDFTGRYTRDESGNWVRL